MWIQFVAIRILKKYNLLFFLSLAFFSFNIYARVLHSNEQSTNQKNLENRVDVGTPCEMPPSGISDVEASPFYMDRLASKVDEGKARQNGSSTEPFRKFVGHVIGDADRYVLEKNHDAGLCAILWIYGWANDGAMLGSMLGERGGIEAANNRKAFATAIGIAYIKVKDLATDQQAEKIIKWLMNLDEKNRQFTSSKKQRNNLLYWSGVESLTAGLAAHDVNAIAYARHIYHQAIDDIANDGSQPFEVSRGERALIYSNVALQYMLIMAQLSRCANEDWFQYRPDRLNMLVYRVLEGASDSSWYQQKTGERQLPIKANNLGWVLIYPLKNDAISQILLNNVDPRGEYHVGGNWKALSKACQKGGLSAH